MEEARVVLWLNAPGEHFARGDVLLEVETDKTVVEVPALEDRLLTRHLVAPGEVVALGQPIAETEGDEAPVSDAAADSAAPPPEPSTPGLSRAMLPATDSALSDRVRASPRARRLGQALGVDISGLVGTGRRGRISGRDVEAARGHGASPGAIHVRRRTPTEAVSGAPLVLLHGLFDTARGWRDLPERLAQAGHPVMVPDLPGHGRSGPGNGTLAGAVSALEAVLPSGPVGLVGHSLGAVIAAHLAERLGRRLDRLVLVAPAGLGPRMDRDFLDLMANAETTAALGRALARLGPGVGPFSEEALAAELDRLRAGRETMVALSGSVARQGVQQLDIVPVLDRLAAPVVALFGLEDPVIDWRDAVNLPPRVGAHFLRGAGHLPHAARPDLVAELILGYGGARDGPAVA
jgi:pyruvate dehydrogenase E2 component (dihydrolipoamide acetyltransferase)